LNVELIRQLTKNKSINITIKDFDDFFILVLSTRIIVNDEDLEKIGMRFYSEHWQNLDKEDDFVFSPFKKTVDEILGYNINDKQVFTNSKVLDSITIIHLPVKQQKCALALLSMNQATGDEIAGELKAISKREDIIATLEKMVVENYIFKKLVDGHQVYSIR
jgi:hypothetical protein